MPAPPALAEKSAVPSEKEFIAEYGEYLSKIIIHNSYKFVGLLPLLGMGREDLVQEGLMRALQARRTFSSEKGVLLKTWVVTQVSFYVNDQYRRCRMMQALKAQHEELKPNIPIQQYPRQIAREWELLEDFRRLLSPLTFAILELRLGGLSYAQIAEALRCPVGRVRRKVPQLRKIANNLLGGV